MDNLLELIGNQVTPEVINAAGSMVGTTPEQTQSAMSAGIPAMVGSLLQAGSSPQGATQILEGLAQQPPDVDMLGDFAGMLSGGGQSSEMITSMGGTLLSSLLGDNQENVVGLISSLAGIDPDKASGLMKILMPLGTAVLGKVVSGQQLDAGGLINLLMGQKDALRSAAPPGLTDALGISSFDDIEMPDLSALSDSAGVATQVGAQIDAAADAAGDAVSDAASSVAGAADDAASAVTDTAASLGSAARESAGDAGRAVQQASGGTPTWVWIVAAIVILALLWFFFF